MIGSSQNTPQKLDKFKRSKELKEIETVLNKHLSENKEMLNYSKDKDVLLLIGSTGAGKTSLISYLTGLDLNYESDDSEHGITLKNTISGFQISGGSSSVTMLPNFRSLTDSSCLLYDLPGLEDTRGSSYEILNASFIKNIVENAKTVGFIFIEDKATLSSKRGKGLKTLVQKAKSVFKVDKSNSLLVITKVKNSWNDKKLHEWIKKDFDNELEEDSLLLDWLNSDNIFCRHKNIDEEDKNIILKGLKQIKGRKHHNIDVSALYSDNNMLTRIIKELKNEVFSSLEFDKSVFDLKSSKEVINFINDKNNILKKYEITVEKHKLITLLYPLTGIDLNDWKEEVQQKISSIIAQAESQKRILLSKEKAEEEAKREAENRKKAEEEAKREVANRIKAQEQAERERKQKERAIEEAERERYQKMKAEEEAKREVANRKKAEEEAERQRQQKERAIQEAKRERQQRERAIQEAERERQQRERAIYEAEIDSLNRYVPQVYTPQLRLNYIPNIELQPSPSPTPKRPPEPSPMPSPTPSPPQVSNIKAEQYGNITRYRNEKGQFCKPPNK